MAQFYDKDQQAQFRTFNSNSAFGSSSKISKTTETTYMNILDTFRRIFKGIDINNLHA